MLKKKLKSLISFIYKKRAVFLLILLLGITIPFFAHANWLVDLVGNTALKTATAIFRVLYVLPLQFAAGLSADLFNYLIDPANIGMGYANPATNPIIELGLSITRPFANLAIIFILILIGLATALNFKEYQAQKLLPKLLIVALLVNFVPLFLGMVIDAANVITFYFLEQIQEGPELLMGNLPPWGEIWGDSFTTKMFFDVLATCVLYQIFAIVFFVYAFIFLYRYVYIWALVILSPLAFVAWVFPPTKKMFSKWWNDFLSWSFIGVPVGFFLYIALSLLEELSGQFAGMSGNTIISDGMPYVVVMIFLWIGAGKARDIAKKGAKLTTAATGVVLTGGVAGAVAGAKMVGDKVKEGAEGEGDQSSTGRIANRVKRGAKNTMEGKNKLGRIPLAGYATRRAAGRVNKALSEKKGKRYDKVQEKLKNAENSSDLRKIWIEEKGKFPGTRGTEEEVIKELAKRDELQKAFKDDKFNLNKDDITKAYKTASDVGDKDLMGDLEKNFIKNEDIQDEISDIKERSLSSKDKEGRKEALKNSAQIKKEASKDKLKQKGIELDDKSLEEAKRKIEASLKVNKDDPEAVKKLTEKKEAIESFKALKKVDIESLDNEEEIANTVKEAGVMNSIKGLKTKDIKEGGYKDYKDKILDGVKSKDDMDELSDGWEKDEELMQSFLNFADGSKVSKAAQKFGKSFADSLEENIKSADWYTSINPVNGKIRNRSLPKYLKSNGAKNLGIESFPNKTTEDLERNLEEMTKKEKEIKEEVRKTLKTIREKEEEQSQKEDNKRNNQSSPGRTERGSSTGRN